MKYKFFLLLFFILIISGCSLKKPAEPDNSGNDILMAQECGMDGLMCCPDTDPSCQYGQECCVDPNNDKNNYCADKCEFGKLNTFCRKDEPRCDDGLACSEDRCVACGEKDQPCCTGEKCQGEFMCFQGKCHQCGESGSPCCAENRCNSQDMRDDTRNGCHEGVCTFCGSNGGIACETEPYCNTLHLMNNGFCLRCGGYNQPCCEKGNGAEFDCNPNEQLTCYLGFCSKAK